MLTQVCFILFTLLLWRSRDLFLILLVILSCCNCLFQNSSPHKHPTILSSWDSCRTLKYYFSLLLARCRRAQKLSNPTNCHIKVKDKHCWYQNKGWPQPKAIKVRKFGNRLNIHRSTIVVNDTPKEIPASSFLPLDKDTRVPYFASWQQIK